MPYLIAALIVLAVLAAAIFLGAAAALYCNVMRRGIAKLNERKLRRGVEPTPYRRQAAENAPLWEELEKQTQTLRADDEPPAGDEYPEYEAASRRPVAAGDDPQQGGRQFPVGE